MRNRRARLGWLAVQVALALLSPPAHSAAAQQTVDTVSYRLDISASRAWFEAHATLGDFDGESRILDAWAQAPPPGALLRLESGEVPPEDAASLLAATRGAVAVTVAGFRTGIGARDGHLRAEMDADHFPAVVYTLSGARAWESADGTVPAGPGLPVTLLGEISVRGHVFPLEVAGRLEASSDGFGVEGRIPTRFTSLGMEPPRRLAGLATVKDELLLGFDLRFRRPVP